MTDLFLEIEEYATKFNVPIMRKDAIDYIVNFLESKNIKTVLEIGTAIAYSALKMSNVVDSVTTIERDEERLKVAYENIKKAKVNNINIIKADALEINLESKYDFILIDAAKSQNIKFIEKYKKNLKPRGYIFIDNIDFHGLVGKSSEIKSKNLRALVRKIEEFLSFLDEQNEFKVTKINIGDGLIKLERNNND